MTAAAVASIREDYDLAGAEVRTVRVERAGQELSGYVALAARRRYTTLDDPEDAVVELFLRDVRTVRFDSGDGAVRSWPSITMGSRCVSALRRV